MKASIVLPTYNEADGIVEMVEAVFKHRPPEWDYEVIVVDDNSPDGTYEKVRTAFAQDPRVRAVLRTQDRGLAKSIRAGFEISTGDRLITLGSDFTHDPLELPKMLVFNQFYDIVSGSRFCPGGRMEFKLHYYSSMVYSWFVRPILQTQIQDNFGCFFCIRRECLESLPWDDIFYGYGDFYFRLLHHAQRQGMSVLEIPAYYHTRKKGSSKSHFLWLLFQYTTAVLAFRFRLLFKKAPEPSS